jgi:uncharacterized Zn finger protein
VILVIDGVKIQCQKCGHEDFRPLAVAEPKALTCAKCGMQTTLSSLLAQLGPIVVPPESGHL